MGVSTVRRVGKSVGAEMLSLGAWGKFQELFEKVIIIIAVYLIMS